MIGLRPLRGAERIAAWLAFHVWTRWPFHTDNRGIGRVWWWLLPWAGLWGFQDDAADQP